MQALDFDFLQLSDLADAETARVVGNTDPEAFRRPGERYPLIGNAAGPILATGSSVTQYRSDRLDTEWGDAMHAAGYLRFVSAVLMEGEDVLGVLDIGRRQNLPFTPGDEQFARLVATLLAQSVTNRLRLQQSETEASRNRFLGELAVLLSAGEPIEGIFDRVQALMDAALPSDHIALVVDDGRGMLRVVGSAEPKLFVPEARYSLTDYQVDWVVAGGEALVQFHTGSIPGPWPAAFARIGIERLAVVVLRHHGAVHGLFSLGRRENRAYTAEECAFVEIVGVLLAQAIASQSRLAESVTEAQRATVLNELSVLVNAGQPVDTLFDSIRGTVGQALTFDFLSLHVATSDGFRVVGMEPNIAIRPSADRAPGEIGLGALFGPGESVAGYRPADFDFPAIRAMTGAGLERAVSALMGDPGGPLGVLTFARQDARPFTPAEVSFIALLATLLAQAEANQRRIAGAEADAHRAGLLTGLAVLLSAGEPVAALFERLSEVLGKALDFDSLVLFGEKEGRFVVSAASPAGALEPGLDPQVVDASVRRLFERDIRVGEFRPEFVQSGLGQVLAAGGARRCLVVTLRHGPARLGALGVGRMANKRFSEMDQRFLDLVGTLLAQAMAGQQRLQASELEAEEQRVIAEVAAIAASTLDAESVMREIVKPIRRFVPRPFVTLGFIDGEKVVYPTPGGEPVVQLLSEHTTAADATGQSVSPEPDPQIYGYEIFTAYGCHAMTLTTCQAAGAPSGYLVVGSRLPGYEFGERELRLLRLTAQMVGPAMASIVATNRITRERTTYNLALASMKDAVILVDRQFRTVYANALGERLVDAIDPGRQFRTVAEHLPAMPAELRGPFERAATNNEHVSGRALVPVAGVAASVDYDFIPLDDPDLSMLVVASDVTAEVQHEEQRERHREEMEKAARLAALGELIGGVAHELNNPLTAILGFAELMEKASPGEDFEEEVEIIRKEALRARDIVRDLLFIARPGQVERGEVRFEAVVGHVERLRRPAWSQLGIDVSIDTAGMGSPIYGNEHQLTQVLLNLVTNAENAVKDNPRPRIAVRARTRGESAIIEVEDNGHGMDTATRDRIFEPFFTTRQGDGTGLGLSLSYSMVAAHDGQIEVQSTPGAGTIFRVVLPLRAEAPSPPEPASPAPAPAHARALVVDDEPSLRVLSQRLIGSMGHECAVAPDSATATALAQEQGFDLVICDYRLATETAGAVIAGFQQVAPELVERTVIATGATTDPGVVELVERHNLRLIAKPYGIDEIAALLAEAAARR
ncbi:MAG: response regulator [Chloroflexi bacterium CFX7]|nr:response regulator [Chloroflexi bacterium CFX7]